MGTHRWVRNRCFTCPVQALSWATLLCLLLVMDFFNRHSTERRVVLYTRKHCHLCDELKHQLVLLQQETDFEIEELNVDLSEELRERYNERVPVIEINGHEVFDYPLNTKRFLEILRAEV